MAEAALRQELKKRKIRWYQISSAGLRAQEGAPMADHAKVALSEAGIPFSEQFCARKLTPKMVKDAAAVICMTREQAEQIGKKKCHKHGCICRERYSGSVRTGD